MSSPEGTRTLVSRISSSHTDHSLGLDHVHYVATIPEAGSPMILAPYSRLFFPQL